MEHNHTVARIDLKSFWRAVWRRPVLTALLLAPLTAMHDDDAPKPAKPNIIFILTDDLGYGDLGVLFQNTRQQANNRSKPWELTPKLDRFAAEGAQLRSHYCAAPVCAPSRGSILLGVSQGHANVRDNQFDKALENNHTLATVLKQAGYASVAVGKWGLQGNDPGQTDPATWPAFPTKRGFDAFVSSGITVGRDRVFRKIRKEIV
jgi:arylsulfatase A-like enzyme